MRVTRLQADGAGDTAADAAMARIAAGVAEELSVPVSLLDGYLQALVAVSGSGRRLTRGELEVFGRHGQEAVALGVPLPVLVDTYLTATWQAWEELPAARATGSLRGLRMVTRAVLRAADDAAAALADGYDHARRITIRHEEGLRREFIDDLLDGRSDVELLAERAERFGLGLGSRHVVAVARAQEPLTDATPLTQAAEARVTRRFGGRDVLVATKAGLLVCVIPAVDGATDGGAIGELFGLLRRLGGLQAGGLRLGARTVTYRLERVRSLTGYAATDPAHRFTLEAAVLGARLLDWPAAPIDPIE